MTDIVAGKDHAKRSPSGAKKRALCPGSVVLEADREDRPSRYAAEGTVAHAIMELCLTEGKNAEAYVGRVMEADGFEFEVDMAMADPVNEFVDWALSYVDPLIGDVLLVEQQVPIGHISGEEGATGTADVVGITEGGTRLVVLDLKYGRGVPVHAADENEEPNLQLSYYGLGALEDAEMLGYDIQNVTLGIGQPRLNNFDAIELTVEELRTMAVKLESAEIECDRAEEAALAGDIGLFLHPGEDQCRFCKAKAVCPALLGEVVEAVSFGSVSADDFEQLDSVEIPTGGNMLSIAMAKVGLIEDWCKAVRAECEAELFAGRPVQGYKLVQGKKGNRTWKDEAGAALVLKKSRLPVDQLYSRKLVTPTAAEKLLKDKPKLWNQLAELITQSDGQPSVAPESDKRPALDLNASLADFEDLDASGNDLI